MVRAELEQLDETERWSVGIPHDDLPIWGAVEIALQTRCKYARNRSDSPPCPPTSASVAWLYARQRTGDAIKSFAQICSCTMSMTSPVPVIRPTEQGVALWLRKAHWCTRTVVAARHARLLLRDADVALHARGHDRTVPATSAAVRFLLTCRASWLRVIKVDRSGDTSGMDAKDG